MQTFKCKLSLEECKEKQIDEYEALKAIYWDCKIVDLRKKPAWNAFVGLEFQISLSPLDGESRGTSFVGIDLYIKCSTNYPNVKPVMELKNACGLDDSKVKELYNDLSSLADSLVGEVMIHDLCNCIRSYLHANNKPPKESCYEEMMKSKQKEEEEKNRQDQEKCHNEVHMAEQIKLEIKRKLNAFKKEKKCKSRQVEIVEYQAAADKSRARSLSENSKCNEILNDVPVHLFDQTTGSRLQDDFETLENVGRGGFGDVIKVQNRLDGRFYAIKRIPLTSHNMNVTRKIIREIKLLSRLNHENVVRYYNSWMETSFKEVNSETKQTSQNEKIPDWGVFSETFEDEEDDDEDSSDEDNAANETNIENQNNNAPKLNTHEDDSESVLFIGSENNDDETSSQPDDSPIPDNKRRRSRTLKLQFLYIQMEFCEKNTLKDVIDGGLYKDLSMVWKLFREIIEGLIHIHDQGIIHRDLKPVNIFLDSNCHVKIGDFGLATVASDEGHLQPTSGKASRIDCDNSLTSNIGTALYVSPEILDHKKKQTYNQKVDLYSLGIIFFEMSYKPLQTSMERSKVLSQLRQSSITLPLDVDSIMQTPQIRIIKWLLDHNAKNRPTARDLLSSEHFPVLPCEEQAIDRAIVSAIKNVNSHAHKNLIQTIFSQSTSTATEYAYDYHFSKGKNQLNILEQNRLRDLTIKTLKKIFTKYGGLNVEVPLLMPGHKLYPESAPVVQLMNKSGGLVTLPFDSKISFARFVEKQNIKTLKRYSISKVFRENLDSGVHPFEVWEVSFDMVTSSSFNSVYTDTEILLLAQDVLHNFPSLCDKDFKLKINHYSIISAIMSYCNIDKKVHQSIFLILYEYKNMEQQKTNVVNRLLNIGLKEDVINNFLSYIDREGTINEMSSFLKCITKVKTDEARLVKDALNYLTKLITLLESCNFKFKIIVSLKLCNNLNIYSGIVFQISRNYKKKLDVLVVGGAYDTLLNHFRQLGNFTGNKKHVVGFNMPLEKLSVSMKLSMSETKFTIENVQVIIWNNQSCFNNIHTFNILQILWDLNVPCRIYDNHEDPNPNVESLKLYCKVHQVPYFIILENDMLIYKIESDKDRLLFKQNSESEFHNFLKTKFNKSKESTAITPIKSNQTVHNVEDLNEDFQFVDVRLVGSQSAYKQSNKILSSMKQLLSKFKKGPIHILLAEISKYMLKSIAAAIDLKDESSLTASINSICKEFQKEKKYIQKIGHDIASLTFKNNQFSIIILYSLEDEVYKMLM